MDILPNDIKQIIYNYDYTVNYVNLKKINTSIINDYRLKKLTHMQANVRFLSIFEANAIFRCFT